MKLTIGTRLVLAATLAYLLVASGSSVVSGFSRTETQSAQQQTAGDAAAKSAGCLTCHTATDEPTMHPSGTVTLGCTDCHGGDASVRAASAADVGAKMKAHPPSRRRSGAASPGSANPVRAYTDWLQESAEYIRFVNPGDLRVADQTCGTCHAAEVQHVRTSMMTHGAMLWGAALYNNGAVPQKDPRFGESYGPDGTPQRLQTWPPPTAEETLTKGVLAFLDPIERWEVSQPGNVLRVFERGGRRRGEIGNPARDDEAGRPEIKLGDRGFGTELRTDPVFLGLQKTRLFDPLLSFPGTNDQPGDYRGSGCTACHTVYANDRSPAHSAQYASNGNGGRTITIDPTIPKDEPGHPLRHAFTRSIPSSQCMTCHMHPGTNMVATYYGYTFWDNETDGEAMYPAEQRNPSEAFRAEVRARNPEGSAARGLWADTDFLSQIGTPAFNAKLKNTQFADFHSHGWVFRAVFKRDRKGELLDANDTVVSHDDPDKFGKAVHLQDIHLEKGMQCVDCHFNQDSHGNGKLYGETRNAVEIDCVDCHGTIRNRATLVTSGPAAPAGGTLLQALRTPFGDRRFSWRDGKLFQRSMMDAAKEWEVVQVLDTVTPGASHYSEQSRLAKTMQRDGKTWGTPADDQALAHANSNMTCYTCHTSWAPSCFGCHLSMSANSKMPALHNEGLETRNYTAYDFQVLRDDMFMLGRDGTVTGRRIAPVRSACAVLVSSENQQRDWLYYMQPTVSAEGFSGQAFSTFVPHTVRATETKKCADCHVSQQKDNNAWMATLLLQGTNFVNQIGRYAWVASGAGGFEAITVATREEPTAVYGSHLQQIAYPDDYKAFVSGGRALKDSMRHPAGGNALDIQVRGEYAYVALGKDGVRIFDIANIDNKDISERVVSAPVSPLGQRLSVATKDARAIAAPSTLAIDPARTQRPENEEQKIHPMYGYLYVADAEEGLIVIGAATLLDGNPANNFITRGATFNPDGKLTGAHRIAFAGTSAYVLTARGLVVVSLDDPLHPRVTAEIGAPDLDAPTGIAVQFRYAFVTDRSGLRVLDVTNNDRPRVVAGAGVPLEDARNIYLARTYAYVSGGRQGLAIVDIERPEQPTLKEMFTAAGAMNDVRDVKIGMTAASQFAYVADGQNGLRVVQLFSPGDNPDFEGFSPPPTPSLVATFKTRAPALAVSEGIDRDRAVDESGNQLAVFGRRGARPFNGEEQRRMYLRNGQLYTVTNDPPR